MKRRSLLSLLALLPALAGYAEADRILHRTKVPNAVVPQGEVRLLVRGKETVVQSAVKTRFPDRVLKKIRTSEEQNWPDSPERKTYIEALEKAFREGAAAGGKTQLTIDFISGPDGTRVELRRADGSLCCTLALKADYVMKNQSYILADAFGADSEAVKTLHRLQAKEGSDEK